MRQISGVEPYDTSDRPIRRESGGAMRGVHQDITFPVHPDPISGMHCWHQMVRVERAGAGDRYGDIFVDTKSFLCGVSAVEGAYSTRAGARWSSPSAVDAAGCAFPRKRRFT